MAPSGSGIVDGKMAVAEPMRQLAAAMERRRLAHAYLLSSGRPGALRDELKELARLVLCLRPELDLGRACGACRSCSQVERGSHPDLLWMEPDGGRIKIEQVKQLKEQAALAPLWGERRAVVVPDAHLMSMEAANAFLKLLEEPPSPLLFLLGIPQGATVLSTISSRCHRLSSRRLSDREMAAFRPDSGDPLLLYLAHGDPKRLERLADERFLQLTNGFLALLEAPSPALRTTRALALAQEAAKDRELVIHLMHLAALLCRDLMALSDPDAATLLPVDLLHGLHRPPEDELWDYSRWLAEVPLLLERNINPLFLAEGILLFWV